jgi:phosphoribosylformylglycinamidine synthase
VRLAGATPVALWHGEHDLRADAIVLPGGFSYGDSACAAIALASLPDHGRGHRCSREGMPVLGICNGSG